MNPRPILFATPVLAWPADQGSRRFLLESARALQCLGPVTWLTREIGDQGEARHRLEAEGFELALDEGFRGQSPIRKAQRRLAIDLRARLRGLPREESFVSTPRILELAQDWWSKHPQGLGVAAYWTSARTLEFAPKGRRVLLAADVESDCLRMAQEGGFRKADAGAIEELRKAEAEAFGRADLVGFLTDEDRAAGSGLLAGEPAPATTIWPTFLPGTPSVAPFEERGDGLRVLVYGHWKADFNRDGLEWFLREIWSPLSERHPSVTLRIVGADAPPVKAERCEMVGFVADLSDELSQADVVVLPLRFAGGMRYRLLEALGFGAAVVATPVAARGSGAVAGEHYLEAAGLEDFDAALVELSQLERRRQIGGAGRDWARRTHGTEDREQRVRGALAAILEGGD